LKAILIHSGSEKEMFPINKMKPKCLLTIGPNNKTIIQDQLDYLVYFGIKKVLVYVEQFPMESVTALMALSDKYKKVSLSFIHDNGIFGSGGAILNAIDTEFLDKDEDFIVLENNYLFYENLGKLVDKHKKLITAVVKPVKMASGVFIRLGKFGMVKKVERAEDSSGYLNMGQYIINGGIYEYIKSTHTPCSLPLDIINAVKTRTQVTVSHKNQFDCSSFDKYFEYFCGLCSELT